MRLNGRMAQAQGGSTGRLGPWVGWLLTILALLVVGGVVFWWVMAVGLKPVVSPSPSASSSSVTVAPVGLAAVNGDWCPADDSGELGCVTVDLPTVTIMDAEQTGKPTYVFPPGAKAGSDPLSYDFGFPANLGECWQATIGATVDKPDAAFVYCPVGALSGDEDVDASNPNSERLWITQDLASAPMVRAAGN